VSFLIFAYVTELREESDTSPTTYDIITPEHQWRMGTISDAPYFILDSYLWAPRAGKAFKVVGQRRPTTYTSDSEAVEANFEAFLRERSAALALYYIAGLPEPNITRYKQDVEGDSPPFRRPADAEGQLDQRTRVLLRLADIKYATSERMATYHPQEFRVDPSGQNVPGR